MWLDASEGGTPGAIGSFEPIPCMAKIRRRCCLSGLARGSHEMRPASPYARQSRLEMHLNCFESTGLHAQPCMRASLKSHRLIDAVGKRAAPRVKDYRVHMKCWCHPASDVLSLSMLSSLVPLSGRRRQVMGIALASNHRPAPPRVRIEPMLDACQEEAASRTVACPP